MFGEGVIAAGGASKADLCLVYKENEMVYKEMQEVRPYCCHLRKVMENLMIIHNHGILEVFSTLGMLQLTWENKACQLPSGGLQWVKFPALGASFSGSLNGQSQ